MGVILKSDLAIMKNMKNTSVKYIAGETGFNYSGICKRIKHLQKIGLIKSSEKKLFPTNWVIVFYDLTPKGKKILKLLGDAI